MEVGILVAIPALSGSLFRIPFSAWVDTTGGRRPFLVLLLLSIVGMVGLTLLVNLTSLEGLSQWFYWVLLVLGIFCGCGIATFSVGISQVSYWYPQHQQGRALAIFAGFGNIAPGVFSFVLPFIVASLGLGGAYLVWSLFLALGTILYAVFGRNAWYFQYLQGGFSAEDARRAAAAHGQTLFPAGSMAQSLRLSARVWKTWVLLLIYFSTFGGFVALTAWFPTYWIQFFGTSAITAGVLTALYSLLTSVIRIAGGVLSDKLKEGGENTAILALLIMLVGALVLTTSSQFELSVPGIILLAIGMGICNAAVFKLVPQEVPQAVGGAAGWVGGLGAFGGFAIPPMLGFAVGDLGVRGYAIGFVVFIFLALLSLMLAWILKYTKDASAESSVEPVRGPVPGKNAGRD
jgi:NNP family nitrate/nitrite transporter-like MFS transporter